MFLLEGFKFRRTMSPIIGSNKSSSIKESIAELIITAKPNFIFLKLISGIGWTPDYNSVLNSRPSPSHLITSAFSFVGTMHLTIFFHSAMEANSKYTVCSVWNLCGKKNLFLRIISAYIIISERENGHKIIQHWWPPNRFYCIAQLSFNPLYRVINR